MKKHATLPPLVDPNVGPDVKYTPRAKLEDTEDFVKILYYGDPGSGKTTALAHLATTGRIIHIDSESGLKAKALRRLNVPLTNIEPFKKITFSDLEALFWEIKARIRDGNDAPVGVIWDSVTETQKKLLEATVKIAVEKAGRAGKDRDPWSTERQDWGVNTDQMRQLVRKFRDLECHIGFACLPRRDQDDDGTVTYGPALTPALQLDLMGYVDIMCHTYEERIDNRSIYLGRFRRAGKFHAKDRFGILPAEMMNPTLDRIVEYINGDLTEQNDPQQAELREIRKPK